MADAVSITLTSLDGPDAPQQVARLLALVFEEHSPASILPQLTSLPLVLTSETDEETAQLIARHLAPRGGVVRIEPIRPAAPALDAGGSWSGLEHEAPEDEYAGPFAAVTAAAAPPRPAPEAAMEEAPPDPEDAIRLGLVEPPTAPVRAQSADPSEPPPWERAAAPAAPWEGKPMEEAEKTHLGGLFKGLLKSQRSR